MLKKAREATGIRDDPSFNDFAKATAGVKKLLRITKKSIQEVFIFNIFIIIARRTQKELSCSSSGMEKQEGYCILIIGIVNLQEKCKSFLILEKYSLISLPEKQEM